MSFLLGRGELAGSSEEVSSWEVLFVIIEFRRFLYQIKYQCWGKLGVGVGGYHFIRVGERFRMSIIPKRSKSEYYSERLWKDMYCSERTGFCDVQFMRYPNKSLCVCVCGGGGGRSREWLWRGVVCENWIRKISIKVSVLWEVRNRIGRVPFYPSWGKVPK